MPEELCHCGFGEEFFTIEDGQSICTVCGGHVADSAGTSVEEEPAAGGRKVLIVDDQPFFRSRIREALAGWGHEVLEAGEGLEAVRLLAAALQASLRSPSERVSLVILDLTMPGLLDGFQTLGVLKVLDETLPVIILTSSPPTKDLIQTLGQLKAKKYLNKATKDLEGLLLRNIEDL